MIACGLWRALKKTYCLFFLFEALKKEIEREDQVREPGCSSHWAFFLQHFTAFDSGISELSHGGTKKGKLKNNIMVGTKKLWGKQRRRRNLQSNLWIVSQISIIFFNGFFLNRQVTFLSFWKRTALVCLASNNNTWNVTGGSQFNCK